MATNCTRFDLVTTEAYDHQFLKNKSSISIGSALHKQILKEWKLLQDLPEGISVIVYENRIDLLRAVIIGANGTPYHDCLFFFDIAFPSNYPSSPPLVHYRSYGLRLNPNLYQNGHVCLSLLNTWLGKKNEKWNPERSSILQVLVSIQGLVLNEKPFFNEPFVGNRSDYMEKKSDLYNENMFIFSCKTMLCALRNPPKNFESFITIHFQERAYKILMACKAYVNGEEKIGYYLEGDSICPTFEVSYDFKQRVSQLYPQLLAAFRRNGAVLKNVDEWLAVEAPIKVARKKVGIVKKFVSKVKKVMGFKTIDFKSERMRFI